MNVNLLKTMGTGLPSQQRAFRNPFVEAVLLIIVCVLLGWFIILPKKAQRDVKQDQLTKLEEEHSQIAGKLAKLQELAQNLESKQAEAAELDQAMPLDGKSINLNLLIDTLARQAGVTVGEISIASKGNAVVAGDKGLLKDIYGANRSLQKLPGAVAVIGTFNQLQAFLQKIETSGRIIDVTELALDPAQDGTLNLKLSFNAYYLAP